MSDEEDKKGFSKFIESINSMKVFIASLLFLLPLSGAYLTDFASWANSVYNINTNMAQFVTKDDTMSLALDVLLFIEPAVRNDITSLEHTIGVILRSEEPDEEVLAELRRQYKAKIIELERIRKRIKVYDPNWKSIDDEVPQ